jgi:hypothetical protein
VQTKYSRMQGLQPQHHNGMKWWWVQIVYADD